MGLDSMSVECAQCVFPADHWGVVVQNTWSLVHCGNDAQFVNKPSSWCHATSLLRVLFLYLLVWTINQMSII